MVADLVNQFEARQDDDRASAEFEAKDRTVDFRELNHVEQRRVASDVQQIADHRVAWRFGNRFKWRVVGHPSLHIWTSSAQANYLGQIGHSM
ncbi:hypothetical protein [Mesorhizobium sp. L-8-10]|uniref:hypothetical protein n=1 Tax=Mesorhizobium sp. L-8-10 TaxID=2744523 RepID=UPI001FD47C66|nr:hypothetical protein [Mesorhizobium sp. L-8-10]